MSAGLSLVTEPIGGTPEVADVPAARLAVEWWPGMRWNLQPLLQCLVDHDRRERVEFAVAL
jgi:hypothetical protein